MSGTKDHAAFANITYDQAGAAPVAQVHATLAVAAALGRIADEMAKSRGVAMHVLTDQQADEFEKRWSAAAGSDRIAYGLFANPDPRAV